MNTKLRALRLVSLIVLVAAVAAGSARAVVSDGDLNDDGKVDSADVLLLTKILGKEVSVSDDVKTRADVAPINKPRNTPRVLDVADLLLLTKSLTQPDPDGDGIPTVVEMLSHTNPFSADSDDDGMNDLA